MIELNDHNQWSAITMHKLAPQTEVMDSTEDFRSAICYPQSANLLIGGRVNEDPRQLDRTSTSCQLITQSSRRSYRKQVLSERSTAEDAEKKARKTFSTPHPHLLKKTECANVKLLPPVTKVFEFLRCSFCLRKDHPPGLICKKSHILCLVCQNHFKRCPNLDPYNGLCYQNFANLKKLSLFKFLFENSTFECPNGCKENLFGKDLKNHIERKCR